MSHADIAAAKGPYVRTALGGSKMFRMSILQVGVFPRRDATASRQPAAFWRSFAPTKCSGCRGPGGGGTLPARSGIFATKQENALPCI